MFVVQMSDVKYFEPNIKTHPEFAKELKKAKDNGVIPLAFECVITPDSIEIKKPVSIKL